MPIQFKSRDLWTEIRKIASDRGPRYVAVPYVGADAPARLKPSRGDTLVTRFDIATIRAGSVNPKVIGEYLAAGVKVHRADDLHAKVYVSAQRAIVGSANLSGSSAERPREAGVLVTRSGVVGEARTYVCSLATRSSFIGPELAESMEDLYRPPPIIPVRGPRAKRRVSGSQLWVAIIFYLDFDASSERAASKARESVKKRWDPKRFGLSEYELRAEGSALEVRVGDELLTVCHDERSLTVEPVSVVVARRRFLSRRGVPKVMLILEHRKRSRSRPIRVVQQAIDPDGPELKRIASPRAIRSPEMAERTRALWKH